MKLLREGKSFSGNERNCAFLNCGKFPFANISAVSGLDFSDDGRAIATVDWDHDGDLDLWYHNRTGPRLRFMRNRTVDGSETDSNETDGNWLMLRLVGTTSNRDAIGSRVSLELNDAPPMQRTLAAGDGYLSQSSKWLHFGLGHDQQIKNVLVRWPNGQEESIDGIQIGHRYVITEGTGIATESESSRQVTSLTAQPQSHDDLSPSSRVFLANPVPLPRLPYKPRGEDSEKNIVAQDRHLLIALWVSSCPSCLQELTDWTAQEQELVASGLDILALHVDAVADSGGAASDRVTDVLQEMKLPFSTGTASPELLNKMAILQRITLNQTPSFAVPTSLLMDSDGRLCAIYRGPVTVPTLIKDVKRLNDSPAQRRDSAVPFAGHWMSPPSTLLVRPVGKVFRDAGYVDDYSRYLDLDQKVLARRREQAGDADAKSELDQRYATATFNLARTRQLEGQLDEAIDYYRQGIEVVEDSAQAHRYMADALASCNEAEQAIPHYQRALQLDPSMMPAYSALARLHRTSGDHTKSLNVLEKAIKANTDHVPTRFELGVTLSQLGRADAAVAEFRKVTERRPDHAGAWANLGNLFARSGKGTEAIAALNTAVKLDPANVSARLGLAGTFASSGDMDAAIEQFRNVIDQQPNLAMAHVGLGQALMTQRKWQLAVAEFEQAIQINPSDGGSMLRLASLLANCPDERIRNGKRAVALSEQLARATQGKDPRVLQTLAAAYAQQGDYVRAIAVVERGLKIVGEKAPELHILLESQLQTYRAKHP